MKSTLNQSRQELNDKLSSILHYELSPNTAFSDETKTFQERVLEILLDCSVIGEMRTVILELNEGILLGAYEPINIVKTSESLNRIIRLLTFLHETYLFEKVSSILDTETHVVSKDADSPI